MGRRKTRRGGRPYSLAHCVEVGRQPALHPGPQLSRVDSQNVAEHPRYRAAGDAGSYLAEHDPAVGGDEELGVHTDGARRRKRVHEPPGFLHQAGAYRLSGVHGAGAERRIGPVFEAALAGVPGRDRRDGTPSTRNAST